jgi:hypothetical protein
MASIGMLMNSPDSEFQRISPRQTLGPYRDCPDTGDLSRDFWSGQFR